MSDELTAREEEVLYANYGMPATAKELARNFGISESFVWDIAQSLRNKGYNVAQDGEGRYFVPDLHETGTQSSSPSRYQSSSSKAKITRDVNEYLEELEKEIKEDLSDLKPARADLVKRDGNTDLIIPRGDDHFGQVVKNQAGEEIINSETEEERVRQIFREARAIREVREDMGTEFDTAHLLLGGDIVTNESIYEGQAFEVDETLDEQINRSTRVYAEQIHKLSREFPTVQVVATPGNHGQIRTRNSSAQANADGIVYDNLDRMVRSDPSLDNVQFIQSAHEYYVNFQVRDWNAHMRHGHGASLQHIGTSAGEQRWLTWLHDHDFDVAYRFHYHMLKEEPVVGTPVFMGGSIMPQTNFEESRAISGRAAAGIHGANDYSPATWTERVFFS